jgi:peptidoglycan/xylan/chitin deacetylase (PgdA/CDA1 family)
MRERKYLILSFDVEEFDTPLEYGKTLSMEDQFSISEKGFRNFLKVLNKHNVTSTIFVTANFALRYPALIKEVAEKHEIASHGFFHTSFKNEDLLQSRLAIEKIVEAPVTGYRMARMADVSDEAIEAAGYLYNSSLNPTWIPGRYNKLSASRTPFYTGKVLQLPASVTPLVRFPLFWLSVKNFPMRLIKFAASSVLKKDGHVNFYFHPWEFVDVRDKATFGLPSYVSKGSDGEMLNKLESLILWGKQKGEFSTFGKLYNILK